MRKLPWPGLLIAVVAAVSLSASIGKTEHKIYEAKDGSRVVIANKPKEEATPESVVEFYSPDNLILCTVDYSSEDGEHGFGVVKAAWTPDGRYFVFSLTSSGGHQSWFPTNFYSPRDGEIHSLSAYIAAAGISRGDFTLKPPNTVLTEIWRTESQESVPAGFRLDSLMERKQRSHHALQCEGGKIIHKEG